jgi:hypothetical protein
MSTKRPSGRGGDDAHLVRPAPPPRRPRHRGGAAGLPAVWSLWCRPGFRPTPGVNRWWSGSVSPPAEAIDDPVPCRLRRTGCDLGADPLPAEPVATRASRLPPGKPAGRREPCPLRPGRRGLGLRSGIGRAVPRAEVGVRGLGDVPLDPARSPTPPTPSPGRRRELPRGVDLRSSPAPPPTGKPVGRRRFEGHLVV